MPLRSNPLLYEINTWVWLEDLRQRYNRPLTLDTLPEEVFDGLAELHIDAVWLMGIWERSLHGRQIARHLNFLLEEYRRALPNVTEAQIIGSPYAIYRYEVDAHYGGRDALAIFRRKLAERNIRLILDFVPNHVAVDHHWTIDAPEALIQATAEQAAAQPDLYFAAPQPEARGRYFAHGRDPNFPPWSDTAQVDAFSPRARQATLQTLYDIAEQCDGVRCDMAMLMVNRIFSSTWNRPELPAQEFWVEVINGVRARHPEFLFVAEVYWDMEAELLAQGFDYAYDKRLYDRLLHGSPSAVRDHLTAALSYQRRMVRFTENHDEARTMASFGRARGQMAALLCATLPGMTLFYEGQFEGRRVKLPVQLGARPQEPLEAEVYAFYRALLAEVNAPLYHDGVFNLLGTLPLSGGSHNEPLLAYTWTLDAQRRLIIINLSRDSAAQGRVMLGDAALGNASAWRFTDVFNTAETFLVPTDSLLSGGVYASLPPNGFKVYRLEAADR
ncbi:MAG: alpha-amylase [Chloroflexi bacterium]|nr:alpha-amylase [Chloroflexota bacterium]